MAERVLGDLLEFQVQYIAQQCNATTSRARGLAKAIFKKYPHANIYNQKRCMGEVYIRDPVINIVGQHFPGKVKKASFESRIMRENAFANALEKIKAISDLDSIAFPHGIGCGLAGGDWDNYQEMIDDFARAVPHVRVYIILRNS